MDNQENFQTPSKQVEGNEQPRTTIGGAGESRYQGMVESKYELNGDGENEDNRDEKNQRANQLDQIEKQIKDCGRRLEEIHYALLKETDKISDNYLELEQERTDLRKRVMDLDYHHRVICANILKESRQRQAEEKERLIKEAEEESERRKREVQERIAKEREERQKMYAELEESRRKRLEQLDAQRQKRTQKEESSEQRQEKVQGEQGNKQQGAEGEDELARSRRRLRIAEIEAQLAASRLRRSRMSRLTSQLDYLRYTYTLPHWTWRDYYPYYSTPLSAYYPYSYGYPYSYSYPYLGYRWWI